MNTHKRKGDRAEGELVTLLADLTGWPVARRLGLGRHVDTGDLDGLPDCCAQVKAYTDPARAMREILAELPAQWAASGCTFAVGFVRRPAAPTATRWAVVMDPAMFATLLREATTAPDGDPACSSPPSYPEPDPLHTHQLPFPEV
jgi:hypothetical protein